jgi:predicted peptidase
MKHSDSCDRRRWTFALCGIWLALNVAFVAWTEPSSRTETKDAHCPPLSASTRGLYKTSEQLHAAGQLRRFEVPIAFRLLQPPEISVQQRYPLLVFLHGAGERGRDNAQQLLGLPDQMTQPDWRRRFPCFLLAPQCPDASHWSDWMQDLENLIDRLCEDLPVDRRRVYLTGLSMGGFGSWELAARRPELFAAVVPICGGGDPSQARRLKNVPVWAVHGDADRTVPLECSRVMIQALRDAGGQPRYSELPGVGHDSWTQTYRKSNGVIQWLFEQANDCQMD